MLGANVLAVAVVATVVIAHLVTGVDLVVFTADAALVEPSPAAGLLSNLGIIAWAAGAAVAFFGAWSAPRGGSRLLFTGAVVTLFLLLDDALMMHEIWAPRLGVRETLALGMIAVLLLAWFVWVRHEIARSPWLFLAIAIAALGVMLALDLAEHHVAIPMHHLWEEGAKFVGVVNWSAYFIATAAEALSLRSSTSPGAAQRGSSNGQPLDQASLNRSSART